jgi:diacylglycerol kinase (ATP)
MANSDNKGLKRVFKAAMYSWQGIQAAFKNEEAFRQESLLALILIPLAVWLGDTGVEIALMIGAVFLVLIVEILNSAIEAVVDRVGSDYHELSGRAKDMASAAVMFSLFNVSLIWLAVIFF